MLKSDNQTLVLNEFLTKSNGEGGLQLRELGRKIGLAPTSVKKYLEELEKEGIIRKERKEKYPSYHSNTNNKQYLYLKNLHLIRKIHDSGMIEYIEKTIKPEVIVITGINFEKESEEIKLYIRGKAGNLKLEEYEEGIKTRIISVIKENFEELNKEQEKELINGIVIRGMIETNTSKAPEKVIETVIIDKEPERVLEEEGYYTKRLIKGP